MALSSLNSHPQTSLSHRVLARKYRPKTFTDLIGQESCIQVLTNSINMDRLPHAILLTGIRGVGKTTIARIIARSLNCIGADGQGKPTAHPCGVCDPCVAITEDRYMDVIEMDAASRTGVEDVREVIEGGRYKAVSARYKIYIIDEVHMLSKNAFNAFLKTLEEPPRHLIFIFATTELNKVPDTIQSRCMRLPLRRIELKTLITYLKDITQREGMKIDQEAVTLIARAAEGSVRDGLSLLDQAMALCEGNIDASSVLNMLGLSHRTLLFNLFVALAQGQPHEALQFFDQMYLSGSDPLMILHDLMDLTHWVSLHKMSISSEPYSGLDDDTYQKATVLIEKLSFPILSRCWQILLKGTQEVMLAPSTKQAVEIVLLRLCHVAPLPTIDDVIYHLSQDLETTSSIEIKSEMIPLDHFLIQKTLDHPTVPTVPQDLSVALAPEYPVAPLVAQDARASTSTPPNHSSTPIDVDSAAEISQVSPSSLAPFALSSVDTSKPARKRSKKKSVDSLHLLTSDEAAKDNLKEQLNPAGETEITTMAMADIAIRNNTTAARLSDTSAETTSSTDISSTDIPFLFDIPVPTVSKRRRRKAPTVSSPPLIPNTEDQNAGHVQKQALSTNNLKEVPRSESKEGLSFESNIDPINVDGTDPSSNTSPATKTPSLALNEATADMPSDVTLAAVPEVPAETLDKNKQETIESSESSGVVQDVAALLNLLNDKREVVLKHHLEHDCKITFDQQNRRIDLYLLPSLPKDMVKTIVSKLKNFLKTWTNPNWVISIGADPEVPTIGEQFQTKKAKTRTQLLEQSLVQAALITFPDAEIDDVEDHP